MNCRYCGTELPDGALFCGECGRAVTVDHERVTATAVGGLGDNDLETELGSELGGEDWDEELPVVASTGFSIADLAFSSPGATSAPGHVEDHDHELPDGTVLDEPDVRARCPQCGEPMTGGDVFCGECGFVVRTVAPPAGGRPGVSSDDGSVPSLAPSAIANSDETSEVEPDVFGALDALAGASSQHEDPSSDDGIREMPAHLADAVPVADVDAEIDEGPPRFSLPLAQPVVSPRARPIPDPFPWGSTLAAGEDIEATRLMAEPASGSRFVLQFSTGESVTVLGSGLVGRNPSMQPGEYVDQLVPIFDAGKSVSKTHLEYGQESGRFWVGDRYSTNGTTIRQPDAEPRRAEPGRRYFIARGTRVDVGEQFFVVS